MPTLKIEDRWCQYIPHLHRALADPSQIGYVPYVAGELNLEPTEEMGALACSDLGANGEDCIDIWALYPIALATGASRQGMLDDWLLV